MTVNPKVRAMLEKTLPLSVQRMLGIEAPAVPAPEPLPNPVTLSSICGVNGLIPAAVAKQCGIGATRFAAQWSAIQPDPGSWTWGATDNAITAAQAAGLEVCLMLFGTPPWAAAPGQPSTAVAIPQAQAWAAFVRAAATRYTIAPYNVTYFQVWNEPMSGAYFNGSLDEYVEDLLIPAAPIIRAAGGKVVFGGWPCSEWLWAPNAPPYPAAGAAMPGMRATGPVAPTGTAAMPGGRATGPVAPTYTPAALAALASTGLYGLLHDIRGCAAAIDIMDLHYPNPWNFERLYKDWVTPGTLAAAWGFKPFAGLWQTETGFRTAAAGAEYAALLSWVQVPARQAPNVKAFWYPGAGNAGDGDAICDFAGNLTSNGTELAALCAAVASGK
jgi:hypothetical protein